MERRIAIVDESTNAPGRADSLLERFEQERPAEAAPAGLSWIVELLAAREVTPRRLTGFWMAWAHDGEGGEFSAVRAAAIANERRAPDAWPIVLVAYGAGPPPRRPADDGDPAARAVDARVVWTEVTGIRPLHFVDGDGSLWTFSGFLRRAATTFPAVDPRLAFWLYDPDEHPPVVDAGQIAHAAKNLTKQLRDQIVPGKALFPSTVEFALGWLAEYLPELERIAPPEGTPAADLLRHMRAVRTALRSATINPAPAPRRRLRLALDAALEAALRTEATSAKENHR